MEKAIYVKATTEFLEMLRQSQWYLMMRPAQIEREIITGRLAKHLQKK